MAKQIFGVANIPFDTDYIQPDIGEADPSTAVTYLCEYDNKSWYSYDDADVTVTEGQGDYAVNILQDNDDDNAIKAAIKPLVEEMKMEIASVDGALLQTYSLVELMAGVVADDATIKAAIAQTTTDKAAIEANYGF